MKEFLVFTGLRVLMFIGSLGLVIGIWLLFDDDDAIPVVWAVVIAFVLSGVASYFLLQRPRERLALKVDERARRAGERFEQLRAKEDDD